MTILIPHNMLTVSSGSTSCRQTDIIINRSKAQFIVINFTETYHDMHFLHFKSSSLKLSLVVVVLDVTEHVV